MVSAGPFPRKVCAQGKVEVVLLVAAVLEMAALRSGKR